MFVLGIDIQIKSHLLDPQARKFFRDLQKKVLFDTGEYLADNILPRRLAPGNHAKYRHEARKPVYRRVIKKREGIGQGKTVNLNLKGKSRRYLLAFPRISGTHRRVIVRLTAPPYFRKPFVGSWTDQKTGKRRSISRQPDKPAELTRNLHADNKELAKYAEQRLKFYLEQPAVRRFIRIATGG